MAISDHFGDDDSYNDNNNNDYNWATGAATNSVETCDCMSSGCSRAHRFSPRSTMIWLLQASCILPITVYSDMLSFVGIQTPDAGQNNQ